MSGTQTPQTPAGPGVIGPRELVEKIHEILLEADGPVPVSDIVRKLRENGVNIYIASLDIKCGNKIEPEKYIYKYENPQNTGNWTYYGLKAWRNTVIVLMRSIRDICTDGRPRFFIYRIKAEK